MNAPSRNDPVGPASHDAHVSPNSRLGLLLFVLYFVLYLGFMGIAAFNYDLFSHKVLGGVNLAVVYGLGLIAAALILALIYMKLCKAEE